VLDDPVWRNSGHTQKGRDGCRVPLPWTVAGDSFGFGGDGTWLPQPAGFGALSVEAQAGVAGSTLEMYRSALAHRARWFTADEDLTWLELGDDVLAFRRGSGAVCVVNYGVEPVAVPPGEVLVASLPGITDVLPHDAAVWLRPA
jgi:alpha-glucosidase